MAKIGRCRSPAFSPDASWMAMVSDLGGIPQVWKIPVQGGWPRLVTAFDDPVSAVSWSPDGAWLAVSVSPGGGMNQQVYLVKPEGEEVRLITQGGKSNNWLGPWSLDGSVVALASNSRTGDAMDGYLFDVSKKEMRLVVKNKGVGSFDALSRDLKWGIFWRAEHRGNDNLFLVDLVSGKEALLTQHDGPGSFDRGRFSPDGKTVYLVTDKDREFRSFGQVRIDTGGGAQAGTIEVLRERHGVELEGFEVSEDGRLALLLWNVGGRIELELLRLDTLKTEPLPKVPGEVVIEAEFSRGDGGMIALATAGSTSPLDIWLINRNEAKAVQASHSPHAGVELNSLVSPTLVDFQAHDGLALTGWLYEPRWSTRPFPTVLSFHGGPEAMEMPHFDPTYQSLLRNGISVFAPNVRGSTGFGKTFVNLDNGKLRFNAIRDIKSCVDYLTENGFADPKKLGIMGGSYGGYMTMAGIAEYPSLFAAAADYFGIVNFESFFENTEPWMASISKIEYGDPDTERELLRSLSPLYKMGRVTTPTLVLHGANDTNVPVIEAEQVVSSLRQRGVPVEYVSFPDEGHGFVKTENRVRAAVATVSWFVKHLKGNSSTEKDV